MSTGANFKSLTPFLQSDGLWFTAEFRLHFHTLSALSYRDLDHDFEFKNLTHVLRTNTPVGRMELMRTYQYPGMSAPDGRPAHIEAGWVHAFNRVPGALVITRGG